MKIQCHFSALTRQYYDVEIEVPDDADDDVIYEMVRAHGEELDGGEYEDDLEFWEENPPTWERIKPEKKG
jgi:hypothetical protein